MTEPSRPHPVPGPPRPGPVVPTAGPVTAPPTAGGDPGRAAGGPFAGLDERPVAEHVAVFEAEHDRLRRELATIDQV